MTDDDVKDQEIAGPSGVALPNKCRVNGGSG